MRASTWSHSMRRDHGRLPPSTSGAGVWLQQETLPHVLCHCMTCSQAYTDRHNRLVGRVKTAALDRFTVSHENRAVGDTGLRPDLVLLMGEEAIVLDVCCLLENHCRRLGDKRLKNKDRCTSTSCGATNASRSRRFLLGQWAFGTQRTTASCDAPAAGHISGSSRSSLSATPLPPPATPMHTMLP